MLIYAHRAYTWGGRWQRKEAGECSGGGSWREESSDYKQETIARKIRWRHVYESTCVAGVGGALVVMKGWGNLLLRTSGAVP